MDTPEITADAKLSQKEINELIRSFQDSIIFNNTAEPISNILSIIDSPFLDRKGNDILSILFHRFYINTDIPIALPVFGFLSLLSAFCVKNFTTIVIPFSAKKTELATWIMCLAPTGSSKTLASEIIEKMVPEIAGEKAIEQNFFKPNGPAAFVQNLSELPNGRGFWKQDEASQTFKVMEQIGHPMAEVKEYLLLMKDNKPIMRQNAQKKIQSDPVVMTQLFINTIDSMARNISDESMSDGLIRRYQFAMAKTDDRKGTDYPLYRLDRIVEDQIVLDEMRNIFTQDVFEKHYIFNEKCSVLFNEMYEVFWKKQYEKWMFGADNIYRTYLMEAWKYAAFHHIIHKKEGYIVDADSMEWALKVVMFLLNSFQNFIAFRASKGKSAQGVSVEENKIEKFMNFIKENENKIGFGIRGFCRKFHVKKEEAFRMLKAIKVHNPKFRTKLFELI